MTLEGDSADPDHPSAQGRSIRSSRLLKILVGVVVMLVIGELGTRAIASSLPTPVQWSNYEVQRKVQQMDALRATGGAQVVFLGSSLVDLGIDPTAVEQQLSGGATAYNAALLSSIPRESAAWAENVVIPRLHPRVIVLGVSSYDLAAPISSARTAFYEALIGSPGYKQAAGTEDVIQRVNYWIGKYSSLWFHKDELRDPKTVLHAIAGNSVPVNTDAADLASNGRETEYQYRHFINESGVYVGNWTLGTQDPAAIVQLAQYTRAHHIRLVLVDMPVTDQFIATMPLGDYQPFLTALGALGSRSGTKVLYDDHLRNIKYFQDDIHLNHTGAEFFSAVLGSQLKPLVSANAAS